MEQAVFISPDSFTGRPWHFPESACIPYCRCPLELECHGFPCVTSFQPAISHCLWESRCSPSNKVRCPLVFAASCFHPGGRLQACGPSTRPVFTNSTASVGHQHGRKKSCFVPVTVINMVKGMTGLYWKSLPDRNNLQSNPYKTIKKKREKGFFFYNLYLSLHRSV